MSNPESVKIFAFFYEDKDLIKKFCLIFRDGLFPDKGVFIRNGFDFGSINKDIFPGNLPKGI